MVRHHGGIAPGARRGRIPLDDQPDHGRIVRVVFSDRNDHRCVCTECAGNVQGVGRCFNYRLPPARQVCQRPVYRDDGNPAEGLKLRRNQICDLERVQLRAAAQVQDTTVQITMLMEGASTNQSTEQLARLVTSALTAQVRTNALCSLSAPQDIRNLVTQSVTRASITLGTNITDGAAQIIAQVNQLKDQAVASASNALSAAEEISRIQGMAQGGIADDLSLVAANAMLIDDAVAANTGSALQTRVDAAPVGDVTGQETRPGTFAFSLPEFRVLEDGTPLSAVKVTRTDGNKWDVALRITLSDGTARHADGDYSAICGRPDQPNSGPGAGVD